MQSLGNAHIFNILFEKILLYLKKILLGTSNRSKIFQIVFEIWQIYDKIHLRKCTRSGSKATFKPDLEHFPVAFLREIYYFSKTIWDILDLFEVPKSIFWNEMLKIFAWPKGCTQKITGVWKCILYTKSTCAQTYRWTDS